MKNPAIELEFIGPDAHLTSNFLIVFCAAFEKDPTDAAFELKRNLNALVERKHGKAQSNTNSDCVVVSLHGDKPDGFCRRNPTLPEAS